MDWFQEISGFREASYNKSKSQFEVSGTKLRSRVNDKSYEIGNFDLISLSALREQATLNTSSEGKLLVSILRGDVGELHEAEVNSGALFQVASQFNSLEMVSHKITPEHGVARYQGDRTQGPACAVAAGAATIYRNYFVPVGEEVGQTAKRQLNGLSGVGRLLGEKLGVSPNTLWEMRNGYALASMSGLASIRKYLEGATDSEIDALRGALMVGFHRDVEVTTFKGPRKQLVSQVFCSALPVAYSRIPPKYWEPFARLTLEAAYEATIWAAVLNAKQTESNLIYLTLLGGGAFGNPISWVSDAILRTLELARDYDLDVRIVSYGPPPKEVSRLVKVFN